MKTMILIWEILTLMPSIFLEISDSETLKFG